MFNIETLFVLGAGASVPYDYPKGDQLILSIIEDMEDEIFSLSQGHRSAGRYLYVFEQFKERLNFHKQNYNYLVGTPFTMDSDRLKNLFDFLHEHLKELETHDSLSFRYFSDHIGFQWS